MSTKPSKAAVYTNDDNDPANVKFHVGGHIYKLNTTDAIEFGKALVERAKTKLGERRGKEV